MAAVRTAHVVWQGDLFNGGGTITESSSGVLSDMPVTWASRAEEPGGKTSPEELIAAAHASCFSMALSAALAGADHPPTQLDVTASYTFETEGGPHIAGVTIDVKGKVDGLDAAGFDEAAQGAGQNCPVSKALSVPITVNATLDS